jgi:hypothetical protein
MISMAAVAEESATIVAAAVDVIYVKTRVGEGKSR